MHGPKPGKLVMLSVLREGAKVKIRAKDAAKVEAKAAKAKGQG